MTTQAPPKTTTAGSEDVDDGNSGENTTSTKPAELASAINPTPTSSSSPASPSSSTARRRGRRWWSEPSTHGLEVRGPTYLVDGRKVPAGETLGRLMNVIIITPRGDDNHGIVEHDALPVVRRDRRCRAVLEGLRARDPQSLVLVLHLRLPSGTELVALWRLPGLESHDDDRDRHDTSPQSTLATTAAPARRLLRRWMDAESLQGFGDARVKLIPRVVQAPWALTELIPSSRPVLTGRRLTQRCHRGEGFIEIELHAGSSWLGSWIGGLCEAWAGSVIVELFVLLQGERPEELPECVLGGVCFDRLPLDACDEDDTVDGCDS